jgi:hypothetical protein
MKPSFVCGNSQMKRIYHTLSCFCIYSDAHWPFSERGGTPIFQSAIDGNGSIALLGLYNRAL